MCCHGSVAVSCWDSRGGEKLDFGCDTVLSRNADIVWEEPAASILIYTLKVEATLYSETSVTY
jgi:hypothetical protein